MPYYVAPEYEFRMGQDVEKHNQLSLKFCDATAVGKKRALYLSA